jgi:hypothetical protein
MSSDTPEVEYLGPEQPERTKSKRSRRGLAAVAALGVVAVAGAGAYGLTQFMSGGDAPATAVPGNALAYLSLDLDPSGGQKIEVLKTLRKFPAIKEELGVSSQDDLRRWMFEALTQDAPCTDLDFEQDIEPWLGNKVAMSLVPGDDEPVPFGVVEIIDEGEAAAGLAAISECAGEEAPGSAFADGYMVIAETDAIADDIVADAAKAPLSDDDDFTTWVDEAGGAGIVTGYVSAEAPAAMVEAMSAGMPAELGSLSSSSDATLDPMAPFDPKELEAAFEDFKGAAMVVRFDDASLELEMAAGGAQQVGDAVGGDSGLSELPETTAVGLGVGIREDAVEQMLSQLGESLGQEELDNMLAEAEAETGLTLPEDAQTLLGEGVSFAVDSSIDFGGMFDGTGGMALPVGLRITGDPDEIGPILDKVLAAAGAGGQVSVESGDGVIAVGLDAEHVASLAEDGALGDQDAFTKALPEFEGETGGLYVDFDADDWLIDLFADDPEAEEAQENLAPLDSLGLSGNVDGDVVHGVVRLSTD